MSPHGDGREYGEDNYIEGAHGTIAEQKDEAFYDDRSDADDDLEKGRITFPTGIYGRDRELQLLTDIYNGLVSEAADANQGDTDGAPQNESRVKFDKIANTTDENDELNQPTESKSSYGSHVVFLSGYSGVGKSALGKLYFCR